MLDSCWGGGKGHPYGRKSIRQSAFLLMSAELYTEWIEIYSLRSFVRNRSWFSQSNGDAAGCGFICASLSVSAGLCGPCCHPSVVPGPPSLIPLPL